MSTPTPPPSPRRSRARTFVLGCLAAVAVVGVLTIAGCVGFFMWLGAEGEVSEKTLLLTGGEEVFGSLYLTPDNEALLDFTSAVIERNQQMQRNMGGIQRFLPQPDPEKASRQEIEEVLPLRIEGALYPDASGGSYEHLLKAELSQQYRLYGLIFRGAAFMIGTAGAGEDSLRVESFDGVTTIVSSDDGSAREQGFAFVGNTFYWASPPRRIAGASALTVQTPAHFAPSDARLPVILEDVGGETNPVWALVTGPSLETLAHELALDEDSSMQALGRLLSRTGTVAIGFDLENANEARLRIAGLTPRDHPIDDAMRALLAAPIRAETESGFRFDLACEERASDRWSCGGSVLGFRDAFFGMMDGIESQLEDQR